MQMKQHEHWCFLDQTWQQNYMPGAFFRYGLAVTTKLPQRIARSLFTVYPSFSRCIRGLNEARVIQPQSCSS